MTDKHKRRWFQFRLRTLLIGVVLTGAACAYVGHEWRIVEARNAWIVAHKGGSMSTESPPVGSHDFPEKAPSALRRLLGDQQYHVVYVSLGEDSEAQALFPEACVYVILPGMTD